jgi:hypothetical protein
MFEGEITRLKIFTSDEHLRLLRKYVNLKSLEHCLIMLWSISNDIDKLAQ